MMNIILASSLNVVPKAVRKRRHDHDDDTAVFKLVGLPVASTFSDKRSFLKVLSKLGYSTQQRNGNSKVIGWVHPRHLVLCDSSTEEPEILRRKNPYEIRTTNTALVSKYLDLSSNPRPNLLNPIGLAPKDYFPEVEIIFGKADWFWSILLPYMAEYGKYLYHYYYCYILSNNLSCG